MRQLINMSLWFKRKLYGWGWTPCTWQGWLVILAFMIFVLNISFMLPAEPSPVQLISFFAELILSVALVIWICWRKGESPKWQWGKRKE